MAYSEKTQRELDRYTRRLVRRMPTWLRQLFDTEQVWFAVGIDGNLELYVATEVNKGAAQQATQLIAKYMNKHPNPALKPVLTQ